MSGPVVILASGSPRRRELLAAAGFEFEVVSPSVPEAIGAFLTLRELTLLNATRKGLAAARAVPEKVVIAADTLIALGRVVIGKPGSLTEAVEILRRLSGRTHEVCTTVFIAQLACERTKIFSETSQVRFRQLSESEISEYLAKVNPLDKAGGYAAQGCGREIISEVRGSFSNVVGLPMEGTVAALRQFEVFPRSA